MSRWIAIFCLTILAWGSLFLKAEEKGLAALERDYQKIEEELKAHKKELARLKGLDYSGPVKQKDLKTLAGKVVELRRHLRQVDKRRAVFEKAAQKAMDAPMEITVHRGDLEGPLLKGPAKNGDTLAFGTQAPLSGTMEDPVLYHLVWQLYDKDGLPVENKGRQKQASGTGVPLETTFSLPLKDLPGGRYIMALTVQTLLEQQTLRQAKTEFDLHQSLILDRMEVVNPLTQKPIDTLTRGDTPHIFVYFERPKEIESIDVQFFIRYEDAVKPVLRRSYTWPPKELSQGTRHRTGIETTPGTFQKSGAYEVQVLLSGHGDAQEIRKTVTLKSHPLTITGPRRIVESGKAWVTVRPPSAFSRPLQWEEPTLSGPVELYSQAGNGRFQIKATGLGVIHIAMKVTDKNGRTAAGRLNIEAVSPQKKAAAPRPPAKPRPMVARPTAPLKPRSAAVSVPKGDAAQGREAFDQWFKGLLNRITPDCFSEIREKIFQNRKVLSSVEARKWGSIEDSTEGILLEQAEEREFLRAFISEFIPKLQRNQCVEKLVDKVAFAADVAGLGPSQGHRHKMLSGIQSTSGGKGNE